MKYFYQTIAITVIFFGFLLVKADAQTGHDTEWDQRLFDFQKQGMVALGSWAAGNFLVSGYQMSRTQEKTYYFHQMNVLWNTVNMGIAVSGYLGAMHSTTGLPAMEILTEYHRFSKILLVNTGLDVAYMMTGLYLKERSKQVAKHQHRFAGYGNSLLLQGGFLFLFDLTLVLLHEQNISEMLSNDAFQLVISPGYIGVTLQFI